MNRFSSARPVALALIAGVGLAGVGRAAEVLVVADIAVSTTWTANNTYNLQQQIYVRPGATLTIQAGTLIASDTGLGGSLAVTRGGQIFVQGTQAAPVIFTSKADVATWTGGDPTTGVQREGVNEWGNLTIMGRGYVSENVVVANTPAPSATNIAPMEGLVAAFPNDPDVIYGGGNDDDDSGSLSYVSFRYGGRVIGLNNELNGLSLGAIGRATDINFVEIFNNVDDGIEVWGGAVNLKNFAIWNVGDDSLDVDQGWRGKAQFGLIVQGHSANAAQGSGVGDNALELDGAEQSDYQPVTTATLYNMTIVGQPVGGDHGGAYRDNARIQIRNSVFLDLGEQLVRLDNIDGDGGAGYGFNGTLSWANTWTTDYNAVPAHPNDPAVPADFYKAQTSGKLNEVKDSVFFRNQNASAYTEATARGVFDAGNNNVLIPGFDDNDLPIRKLVRGPAVVKGGLTMLPVVEIDPRPAGPAVTSVASAPNDGFFTSAGYRGAFTPTGNWLLGWTAADAFGLVNTEAIQNVRVGVPANPNAFLPGSNGPKVGQVWNPVISHASFMPGAFLDIVALAFAPTNLPIAPFGTLLIDAFTVPPLQFTKPAGVPHTIAIPNLSFLLGLNAYTQGLSLDGISISLTNAIDITFGDR